MKRLSLLFSMMIMLLAPSNVSAANFDEETTYNALYRMLSTPFLNESHEPDLGYVDATMSDFVRAIWVLNELPTDEAYCWWNDPGLPELCIHSWVYNNLQAQAMFARLHQGIFKANLYLENAPSTLVQKRAEVRFLRALFYFHALDLYGNVPLTTSSQVNLFMKYYDYFHAGGMVPEGMTENDLYNAYTDNTVERPKQVGCAALFDFIVNELKAVEADLPAPGNESYARPSKAAAWLLLARLYLNAEVYTGTAQWDEAKTYAKKVLDSKAYALSDNFSYLFMGDNDANAAKQEIVFPIYAGADALPSWGCTTYIIAATHDSNMSENGMTQKWGGVTARRELVSKFSESDSRYMFYSEGHTLNINQLNNGFFEGYAVTKFTNKRSDETASYQDYAETDWPLMRLAEAYLTYAEADAHLNGGTCTDDGAAMLNTLRGRAHISDLPTVTLSDIADEWAREFMFEGRRRSDLIRLGLFAGDSYLWNWKGGQQNGVAIDNYLARYPMPDFMMILSSDYVQNSGYTDINQIQIDKTFVLDTPDFASQTVSLRDVKTLHFTWQSPNVTGADASDVQYQLQMSPSGNFDQPQNADEYIGLGTGLGTYYPFATGDVDTETLDMVLLAWKRAKRWSDLPRQSFDIYFRCVATIANKESVSNVQKITVTPYINNVNATNYYLAGPGIGDGQQTLTHDGIGTSMLPMEIDHDRYNIGWGYMGSGKYTLTTRLIKDSPFYIRQIRSGIYFYTPDGTIDNAQLMNSDGSTPDVSQMFTVSETGIYEITASVYPDWVQDEKKEWHRLPYVTLTKKDDTPPVGIQSVTIAGDATATMQQSAAGHIWYGQVTLLQEGSLYFVVDGQTWGDTEFSFAYAKPGSAKMKVPAGSYIVTLNTATGFYDFYDTNDERFIWYYNPYELMYKKVEDEPIKNYYYVGGLNGWMLTDKSLPFTTKEGIVYHLQIPAPTSSADGMFKIASEEAVTTGSWGADFLTAEYDQCPNLEGYFITGNADAGGAWCLPIPNDGSTHYDLQFNLLSGRYQFTPITPSGIRETVRDSRSALPGIYTLNGVRIQSDLHQLSKGIYIVNGKKVVIK